MLRIMSNQNGPKRQPLPVFIYARKSPLTISTSTNKAFPPPDSEDLKNVRNKIVHFALQRPSVLLQQGGKGLTVLPKNNKHGLNRSKALLDDQLC